MALEYDISRMLKQAHRSATLSPISEMAAELQRVLSRSVAAYVVGVKEGKTIYRWANSETSDIRYDSEQRLRTAYEIVQLLSSSYSPSVARAWLIGCNPRLGDKTPVEAIHEGELREALGAAQAFVVSE